MKKAITLLFLSTLAAPALADECALVIEGNDAMQFNLKEMSVPATCKEVTVTLNHTGKMPVTAMGHNWVLSKTADVQGVATDGIAAGIAKQHVKSGDTRVIAHTKVLGPGETDSVSFDVSKLSAAEAYTFFCSFPGHSGIMKGTLKLVN